jgi:hypothetical protein
MNFISAEVAIVAVKSEFRDEVENGHEKANLSTITGK